MIDNEGMKIIIHGTVNLKKIIPEYEMEYKTSLSNAISITESLVKYVNEFVDFINENRNEIYETGLTTAVVRDYNNYYQAISRLMLTMKIDGRRIIGNKDCDVRFKVLLPLSGLCEVINNNTRILILGMK